MSATWSKAASIAACRREISRSADVGVRAGALAEASAMSVAARISTTVSRSGRARLTSTSAALRRGGAGERAAALRADVSSLSGDCNGIGRQQAADSVGQMLAGERGAADVLNVSADLDRIPVVTTDELC